MLIVLIQSWWRNQDFKFWWILFLLFFVQNRKLDMQSKMNRKEEAIYVDLGINSRLVPIDILKVCH